MEDHHNGSFGNTIEKNLHTQCEVDVSNIDGKNAFQLSVGNDINMDESTESTILELPTANSVEKTHAQQGLAASSCWI